MIRSMYTGSTGMKAQQLMMDTISNNLSNVNTNAFKRQSLQFKDLMYQTLKEPGVYNPEGGVAPSGIEAGMGVRVAATNRNMSQGSIKYTGSDYDMAISGTGMFQLELPNGTIAYSRDGQFQRSGDGTLVTSDGYRLYPEIVVPDGYDSIIVTTDGFISATKQGTSTDAGKPDNVDLGQIELASFINPAGLRSLGSNLFAETGSSGVPLISRPGEDGMGTIHQQNVEASNVEIVDEMVGMIAAQRAYEIVSKAITTSEEMLQTANNLKR
jgi:flagellar basal-body rod protein FlgG